MLTTQFVPDIRLCTQSNYQEKENMREYTGYYFKQQNVIFQTFIPLMLSYLIHFTTHNAIDFWLKAASIYLFFSESKLIVSYVISHLIELHCKIVSTESPSEVFLEPLMKNIALKGLEF